MWLNIVVFPKLCCRKPTRFFLGQQSDATQSVRKARNLEHNKNGNQWDFPYADLLLYISQIRKNKHYPYSKKNNLLQQCYKWYPHNWHADQHKYHDVGPPRPYLLNCATSFGIPCFIIYCTKEHLKQECGENCHHDRGRNELPANTKIHARSCPSHELNILAESKNKQLKVHSSGLAPTNTSEAHKSRQLQCIQRVRSQEEGYLRWSYQRWWRCSFLHRWQTSSREDSKFHRSVLTEEVRHQPFHSNSHLSVPLSSYFQERA